MRSATGSAIVTSLLGYQRLFAYFGAYWNPRHTMKTQGYRKSIR